MTEELGPTLLVADDDDVFRTQLARALGRRGFVVTQASNLEDGRAAAAADSPEYAVVDLRLGSDNGLQLVAHLHEADPTTTIVVLTGYGSIATAVEAVRLGAGHYLPKPADADDVVAAFERARRPPGAPAPQEPLGPADAPSLARAEWEHINRVLMDHGGNISQTARVLGMHRRSLQRKLSKRPVSR